MTNTEKIFELTAPYDNVYQGSTKRILFVCSAGLLRSPTGATVGAKMGFNTRSCGSNYSYALVPISVNLVHWANIIYFVSIENYIQSLSNFSGDTETIELIKRKAVNLRIKDEFNYMDPHLVSIFEKELSDA